MFRDELPAGLCGGGEDNFTPSKPMHYLTGSRRNIQEEEELER